MRVKRSYVLDSYALLAYYGGEPGGQKVAKLLRRKERLHLCLINWGEVAYILERDRGAETMRQCLMHLDGLAIEVTPIDRELVATAARLKARGSLSYADAFAAATAMGLGGTLLTGDPEFESVSSEIDVEWL